MIHHLDKCIDNRGSDYLQNTFDQITRAMGVSTGPVDAIKEFRLMLDILEINYPHSKKRTEDLNILSSSVNPIRLKNNPVTLDKETIFSLYNRIIK